MTEIDKLCARIRGMRQKDVAREAGIAESTLSNILTNKSDPKLSTLTELNAALDRLGARVV